MLSTEKKHLLLEALDVEDLLDDLHAEVYCYRCEEIITAEPTAEWAYCENCDEDVPVFNPKLSIGWVHDGLVRRYPKAPHTNVDFELDDDYLAPRPTGSLQFGKYADIPIKEVPNNYLGWLLDQPWFTDDDKYEKQRTLVEEEFFWREKHAVKILGAKRNR